jgi:lipopolysaccharide/colanic/teichoic acid biosynthesis glycosyltransferase
MYKTHFKRPLDLALSLIGLAVVLPLLVLVAALLAVSLGGWPLFVQPRPGRGGKVFRLVKFRTMTNARDDLGNLLPDAQRITKVGGLVRKTSLDELPQLINVIKGDMSLIGPRPLLVEYLQLYSQEQARRHQVRPGITGWAQVNGRNTISWEQKFEYDVFYVNNISFALDVKIMWLTFLKVIKREGINAYPDRPMEEFWGT